MASFLVCIARFSLATTETWKNAKGEKQSKTEWHNIVVWGKQAEVAEKFLRKGKQVKVEGRIQHRDYTDQAGAKKSFTEIKCDNFVMLGKGRAQPSRKSFCLRHPLPVSMQAAPSEGQPSSNKAPKGALFLAFILFSRNRCNQCG